MSDQKSKWHDTRKARMDELFAGKQYTVMSEETLDEPLETPLGYKVKKGYWLQDTEGSRVWVGKSLLNTLADEYNAVEKPEAKKRGRPRKEPLERAEVWAGRDIPGDASPITQPGEPYTNPNEDERFEG